MSRRGRVFVQLVDGKIIRIFRRPAAARTTEGDIREYPRKDAVEAIRRQVFEKSGGNCRDCGKIITWKFHMDEEIPRSEGGEISIFNSVALCAACHILRDDSKHGKTRRLRFGENG